jgi:hypothetical protein
MGRSITFEPSKFIPDILQWIAGGQTLREYCRQEGKPSYGTVYDWRDEDEDFHSRFARAREIGEELIAQQCLAIADTTCPGQIVTEKADGSVEVKTADMIEHRKLQIHTRLQLLAKWNPKKYGDFMRNEVSGPDGAPIQSHVTVELVKSNNQI